MPGVADDARPCTVAVPGALRAVAGRETVLGAMTGQVWLV
jgi:hypothetical protein